MSKQYQISKIVPGILSFAAVFCLAVATATAQGTAPETRPGTQAPSAPSGKPGTQTREKTKPGSAEGDEKRITPDEAKQLFGLVDQLLKFSSQETGLPIKSDVKRQLTTRA